MASLEIANSISQFGNYMVASEEIEPQWGWDYLAILESLNTHSPEDGSTLGKTIADSFFKRTQFLSSTQGYNVRKRITMSLVNLTMIPHVIYDLGNLADNISNIITNGISENSFIHSVDFAEHYGLTFKGDSGLVDIYDLSSNIKEIFPQLSNLTNAVQRSLNDTITYKINGDSNPNSHGLSIYMPVKEDEFTGAIKYSIPKWYTILSIIHNISKNDLYPPIIQSNVTGDIINGHIYGNDVASAKLWIYTSSMPESNTAIYQDLDPSSFIKKDGSFEYKWNKQILSICNEQAGKQQKDQDCKPALMKLEINKDKKFALIPIRLQSDVEDIDEEVSLKYEINNDGNYTFLGARPETEQVCKLFAQEICEQSLQETAPKEDWPLRTSDTISPIVYSFQSEDDAIQSLLPVEYPPIQLEQGHHIKIKYANYNGTYDVLFRICDYSKNCWSSRWFHFNETATAQPQVIDLAGQKISQCKQNPIIDNFSTYINPLYKFKIQYPSTWQKIERGLPDYLIGKFNSPETNGNGYPVAQIVFGANYWPGTYKEFVDINNSSSSNDPFSKSIIINSTSLDSYPAYMTLSSERNIQSLNIDALIGHTWYTITFSSDSSKFSNYFFQYAEKIINSFQLCLGNDLIKPTQSSSYKYVIQDTNNTNIFENYTHPLFKIKYPSTWKIVEDDILKQVSFNSPITIIPNSNSSVYDRQKTIAQFTITDVDNASKIYNQGMSLEEFAKILLNSIQKERIGFKISESKPLIFDESPAYQVTYNYLNTKYLSPWKDTTIIAISDNKVYFLEYSAESSVYYYYLPAIENMLNSFRYHKILSPVDHLIKK